MMDDTESDDSPVSICVHDVFIYTQIPDSDLGPGLFTVRNLFAILRLIVSCERRE